MSDSSDLSVTQIEKRRLRLARRRRAASRFRLGCQLMIVLAISMVFVILSGIAGRAYSAFARYHIELTLSPALSAQLTGLSELSDPVRISQISAQIFPEIARQTGLDALYAQTPLKENELYDRLALISALKAYPSRPDRLRIPLNHALDLYLKEQHIERHYSSQAQAVRLTPLENLQFDLKFTGEGSAEAESLQHEGEYLWRIGTTWYEQIEAQQTDIRLRHLLGPVITQPQQKNGFELLWLALPSADRKLSNLQIASMETLHSQRVIVSRPSYALLMRADSTRPEIAGAAAAITGSLITLLITSLSALPIGILAAIYLQELAPDNRLTRLLELNINNLAAIPSIIFGLLGAAVFLNLFGLPRSIPLVGGLVLGLMVLPTVIISARAALAAVPDTLREGALALGASRVQMVFHHILPVAGPGILTGTILAMARAIGETAPLLLIGMVAFVHEIPGRADDEATVLPVLIYKWFGSAERAWEPMTAAVILILILILIVLSLIVVVIRWQVDKTWKRS